ncbi:hypothetical protein BST97_07485 [Nonlabens spongiae]|uniref:Uncharacterized protein n=1 Tax=Nonlabens spongiae TaxID=331648 RepID=A0A1W6MK21_9FLAO|nr:hypothetical protein [Nonlabens spongiae]ARN77856.1 hypothetical protein BST97_07485 [Nonlabens spongiae]
MKSAEPTNVFFKLASNDEDFVNFKNYVSNNSVLTNYFSTDVEMVGDSIIAYDEATELGTIRVYKAILQDSSKNDVGLISGFKILSTMSSSFPTNSRDYAMTLDVLENFESPFNLQDGKITSYDLNYNKKFSERNYVEGQIVSVNTFPILGGIDNSEVSTTTNNWEDDCRGGDNGNVSWGNVWDVYEVLVMLIMIVET